MLGEKAEKRLEIEIVDKRDILPRIHISTSKVLYNGTGEKVVRKQRLCGRDSLHMKVIDVISILSSAYRNCN